MVVVAHCVVSLAQECISDVVCFSIPQQSLDWNAELALAVRLKWLSLKEVIMSN